MGTADIDGSALVAEVRALVSAGRIEDAIERLYASHGEELRRFVRSRRPTDPVDDVCQEVWLAAQRALPSFRFEASPRVWLFSIATRKLTDAYRRNRRRQDDVEFDSREVLLAHFPLGPRPPTSAGTRLDRRERIDVVDKILATWPPKDRELLGLRFVSDLTPTEIVQALSLDVEPNTLSQRLVRLVHRLRKQLVQQGLARPPAP